MLKFTAFYLYQLTLSFTFEFISEAAHLVYKAYYQYLCDSTYIMPHTSNLDHFECLITSTYLRRVLQPVLDLLNLSSLQLALYLSQMHIAYYLPKLSSFYNSHDSLNNQLLFTSANGFFNIPMSTITYSSIFGDSLYNFMTYHYHIILWVT